MPSDTATPQRESESPHDPIERQLPAEPHFVLLARDPLASGFTRLYAIVRGRSPNARARAHQVLDAILDAQEARGPMPHKDQQHSWSAVAVADRMDDWRRDNMTGDAPKIRPAPPPEDEQFRPVPTHNEIKAAAPPREPDEAS